MPIVYDENGLRIQSLNEILAEKLADYRDALGDGFNLSESSPEYKKLAVEADRELQIQEAIQALDNASYRGSAKGVALDRNLEVTGHTRQPAKQSAVAVYARGTNGQNISAGSLLVTVDDTGEIFENSEASTIGTLGSKTISTLTQTGGVATATISGGHSYPVDSYVFIEGADQSEYNKLAKITAVTATTFEYTVDSGAVSPATGTITAYQASPVPMVSQKFDAIQALAGTLKNISGSVPGVARVENIDDAILGNLRESDPEARTRADETVSIAGGGFREAIISKLKNVAGVTKVNVFHNVSNIVDPDGRPPGSVECFVTGGTDEAVRLAVFNSVSDGVRMYGNNTAPVEDSQGGEVQVGFSRLQALRIYVTAVIVTNSDEDQGPIYPGNGDDLVKAAISNISFEPGYDVWKSTIEKAINSIDGVIEITSLFFGTAPNPTTDTTIPVPPTQFADIDTDDIDLTSS